MELLERYLQAVGEHLPARGRRDTLAELRANLEAEVEGREEELGRSLNETEVAAILEAHGMPVVVASRYGSQHFLIGPTLFPVYWYTLKRSFPLLVLVYAAVEVMGIILGAGSSSEMGRRIGAAIGHFPAVALTFWAVVTLGFAIFEYGQGRFWPKPELPKWSVRDLPAQDFAEKKKSAVAHDLADLIVSVLIVAWLLAVPNHPYLLIGPGEKLMHGMPFGLTPEWHVFYWQIVGLLIAMIPVKAAMLWPSLRQARGWLQAAVNALGILILVIMVQVRTFLVAGGAISAENLRSLDGVNAAITLAFRLGLAVAVLKFAWDLWQAISERRHRGAGYATVL